MTFFHDTAVITQRNLLRIVRTPALLFFSSIQPVMFLLLFNYVFGGAIGRGALHDTAYINFLLPGILAQTALFGSVQTGVGMAADIGKGVVDRLSSLPISRGAIVAGRTVADAARNVLVVTVMIIVGLLLGFHFQHGLLAALGAIVIAILFGFAFSWISLTIGLGVKDSETAQVAGFVWTFPASFASSVFVPVESMPEWLKTFAKYQPVTQAVDAIRYLTTGVGSSHVVWITLIWIVGIIAVFAPIASHLFRRAD
ncbi:ABC transporter permease [Candidatus Berkelbacteria bacterium]|nr:ABC transporter permease [Candidatus Berkelbacteria bacterium]